MSHIDHETISEEEDSYENFEHSNLGYSIEGESIIDESDSEPESFVDDPDKSNNASLRRSHRESTVLPVKKKAMRILSSDESENDSTLGGIDSSSLETSRNDKDSDSLSRSIKDSHKSNNRSRSLLEVQKKTLTSESESEDEGLETQIPKSKAHTSSSSKSTKKSCAIDSDSDDSDKTELVTNIVDDSPERHPQKMTSKERQSLVIESDTEDDEGTPIQKLVHAQTSKERNVAEKTQSVELNKSNDDDVLNLSTKMRNKRISHQFMFNSEGNPYKAQKHWPKPKLIDRVVVVSSGSRCILNSTSIHSVNQGKMRLSNNFSQTRAIKEISSESSIEILSDQDSDIIEVSSDDQIQTPKKTPIKFAKPKTAARQQTLQSFVIKKEAPTPQQRQPLVQSNTLAEVKQTNQQKSEIPKVTVSRTDYETQCSKVNSLEMDLAKLQNMIENINYEALPDKGELIKERLRIAENRYIQEKNKLDKMNISDTNVDEAPKGAFANLAWEDIEAGTNAVLPKTFGKQAMSTYNAQKAVTLDRLQQLHAALQTCPKDEDLEEDPKGIKVPLMPHQKRALAWILFREKEKPSGGILADDMGLGKTLTMIALIVKTLELEKSNLDKENEYEGKYTKYNGGSLIVCPASLLNQWSGEIDRRLKRGLISYELYHGPKRETSAKTLSSYDVVITTYAIINSEAEKNSAARKIKWRRIILDEAHTIRNYKAQTSEACCQLMAKSRWALTGTPMHNKELDMYALLKFLRCSPFDDLQVWKRWVGDKSSGGIERLHTVISSLMLRRTKVELMEKGALQCMPEKKWELVKIELDQNEMKVYHKVLIFSQTLFAQFLHQRAEKNQDYIDHKFTEVSDFAPNQEYDKMRKKLLKLNKVKDVSQHEILVLLLRLRQICCHPSLITAMLDESREDLGAGDEECDQLNILDQLEKLNIEDDDEFKPNSSSSDVAQGLPQDQRVTLKEASKGQLHPSDPVFARDRASSKIKAMIKVLKEKVLSKDEKAIIVSQWSSYLTLVATHLKNLDIEYDQLDGKVPVPKRMNIVDRLNNPKDNIRVLLLSLTAGGVGLNLVGANHLFLLDLHWNPQLENQAQDRIYRVGQTKPVFVYKFMAVDTIEERIKALQDKKLAMAEGLLTGTKQAIQSKLSMADLRMIFGIAVTNLLQHLLVIFLSQQGEAPKQLRRMTHLFLSKNVSCTRSARNRPLLSPHAPHRLVVYEALLAVFSYVIVLVLFVLVIYQKRWKKTRII